MFDIFKTKNNLYLSEKDINKLEDYITENIGVFDNVFHEIVSPDLHIDIAIINPTKEHDYYILITMGMSGFKMPVPKEFGKANRAELAIKLPKSWNINSNDEKDCWPIRIIKELARFPLYNNCFFANGHYIDWPNEFANTKFNSVVLTNLVDGKNCKFRNRDEVVFYNVIPLYGSEYNYFRKNGSGKFFEMVDDIILNGEIDVQRKRIG